MRGQWVTLSHCWGSPNQPPLTTTRSNLEDMKQSIPIEILPKTFREAVVVTKALGFRYLWIDSLCIIQDDKSDWEREAITMGLVYARSCLTLAASDSTDCHGGLFIPRDYAGYPTISIELPLTHPHPKRSSSRSLRNIGHETVSIDWRKSKLCPTSDLSSSSSLLSTRGWATQEWILSRRVVHFRSSGFLWSCKTKREFECGREIDSRVESRTWPSLINMHSSRRFTYEGDRPISLSSLANELASNRTDDYLYGHWTDGFPDDLLWIPFRTQANSELGSIPSWSWASRFGTVEFLLDSPEQPLSETEARCRVVEVSEWLRIESYIKRIPDLLELTAWHSRQLTINSAAKSSLHSDEEWLKMHMYANRPYKVSQHDLLCTPNGERLGWMCLDDGPLMRHEEAFFLLLRGAQTDWTET